MVPWKKVKYYSIREVWSRSIIIQLDKYFFETDYVAKMEGSRVKEEKSVFTTAGFDCL